MMSETLPGPSLESQIIFRLGSMETLLTTSLKNLSDKIDTLQKDIVHKEVNTATKISALETRLSSFKESMEARMENNKTEIHERVTKLEFFRTELLAKATAVAAVVGFVWIVVAEPLKQLLGFQ